MIVGFYFSSIAGLYGSFANQDECATGRQPLIRGFRIPMAKKSDAKKGSAAPQVQPTDPTVQIRGIEE